MKIKYKKVLNNESAIEIDGRVVLAFDPRYKEYLKWKNNNPDLEELLVDNLKQEIKNKELYNNGAPHVNKDKNGKPIGKCIFYFKNGQKKWEGYYKDYVLEGEVIQYRENGILISKETFVNGEMIGPYEYYYKDGKLRQTGLIKNHIKEGEIKSYRQDGNIKVIENFKNGLRVGDIKRYISDGKVIMSGQYSDNYKIGEWIWYYPNGQAKNREVYEIRVGFPVPILIKVTNWLANGQKIIEDERAVSMMGSLLDVWKHTGRYSSGVRKYDITYLDGKLHGKWVGWYNNGIKRSEGNMQYGEMSGKWTFWWPNGQKELECDFDFGNPVGSVKIYHDSGVLKKNINF